MLRQPVTDPVVRALVTTVTTPRERSVEASRRYRVAGLVEHGLRFGAIAIYLGIIALFAWMLITQIG